jgi:hypothetical protein
MTFTKQTFPMSASNSGTPNAHTHIRSHTHPSTGLTVCIADVVRLDLLRDELLFLARHAGVHDADVFANVDPL